MNSVYQYVCKFTAVTTSVIVLGIRPGIAKTITETVHTKSPAFFRGAELYAHTSETGRAIIFLKKYYDCTDKIQPETEMVSLQETETNMSRVVKLQKRDVSVQENKGVQTPDRPNAGCNSVILYTAEVDLSPGYGNFDITWGYQFANNRFANIDGENNGIALSVHLEKQPDMQANKMPGFSSLPLFIFKQNAQKTTYITPADEEQDKIELSITTPNSLVSIHSPQAQGMQHMPAQQDETVVTGKAPFKKLDYQQGYSEAKPVKAKDFSISPSGEFICTSAETGHYLVAISVKEYRSDKLLSEHPCVFIIDVQ